MATKPASRGIKLFGTDVPDGKKRTLTAGPISAVLDNGALRYIRVNGAEVLRGIAFLVRDENWGTASPVLSDLRIVEDAGHSAYEPGILHELVTATDRFARR